MMYKVFSAFAAWSDVIFIIDDKISYKNIVSNPQTHYIEKQHYVGTFEFDEKFLSIFEYSNIGEYKYYYRYMYEKDRPPH